MSSRGTALCQKLCSQINKISICKSDCTERVIKTFETFNLLHKLDYCTAVLASLPKDQIVGLEIVKKNASRLITE